MGWTFTHKDSSLTTREFFERQFNHDKPAENIRGKIIAFAATWTTAYMAYEQIIGDTRKVFAIVCLLRHIPRAIDGYNFGYKDMDESMGPNESKCPKTILELLTPTEYEYAIEWRKRCWDRIKKRESLPKVKTGDWIKFTDPIKFTDGSIYQVFQFNGGSRFKTDHYMTYRIRNWRDREFAKIPPPTP